MLNAVGIKVKENARAVLGQVPHGGGANIGIINAHLDNLARTNEGFDFGARIDVLRNVSESLLLQAQRRALTLRKLPALELHDVI